MEGLDTTQRILFVFCYTQSVLCVLKSDLVQHKVSCMYFDTYKDWCVYQLSLLCNTKNFCSTCGATLDQDTEEMMETIEKLVEEDPLMKKAYEIALRVLKEGED